MTEGVETEPQYFFRFARMLRATGISVQGLDVFGAGRDPSRVIREAAERAGFVSSNRRAAEYDQVWCVVDVDTHATLQEALTEAGRLGVNVAVTNPRFEIWLIWHYRELTSHVTDRQVDEMSSSLGLVSKHLPRDFPFGNYRDAVARAHAASEGCAANDLPANPGSGVCELVTRIEQGAAPLAT